ncbi:MAG TPA: tyrosine-type recombinase/integrase [Hyphomicrobiaceae bacterium]|nr:tyrosine-type recombinase/integrase [Hyphomicrobiaceae bacterium]
MSERKPSRDVAVNRLPLRTIADLRDAVARDLRFSPKQRQAYRSALNSICAWSDKNCADVAADVKAVRQILAQLNPTACGVSKGRFCNVRSLAQRVFHAYQTDLIDTRRTPLMPEWQALFDAISDAPHKRGLGRLARWASGNGILPSHVDQTVAGRYAVDLAERMLVGRPRAAFTSMCRSWNRVAAQYPEIWPQVRLDAGDRRRAYTLPPERIDAGFSCDLEAMLARFSDRLHLPDGFTRPYEASTCDEMRRIYRRLYTVGVREHQPQPRITSLADLVRVEIAHTILAHYLNRFGQHNTKSACRYAHFLYLAAKYWVRVPADQLTKLHKWRRDLKPPATGMTPKNRAMLRQFESEERVDRLLAQGAEALAQLVKRTSLSAHDARKFQIALAMDLLLAAPVRPQNLASISLSRHLMWGREGNREIAHLVFPAHEVKNDQPLEFRLPQRVIDPLKVYVAKARPLLTTPRNQFLFPGYGNGHKGPGLLSRQIADRAISILGVRVTAHQFRHLVGYIYLKENPGGHEVVRRFLGHKSIETTVAHYAGMEQRAAIALYDDLIEKLRRSALQRNRAHRARPAQSCCQKPGA